MNLGQGLFVTGTDTGVGKTFIAGGLLRLLRDKGIDAVPMKPVQTGASEKKGRLFSTDLRYCLALAGISPTAKGEQTMCPYCFPLESSPRLAAKRAGAEIDVSRIVDCFNALAEKHEAVIVEGAGGVLVPIDDTRTMLDVMAALALPVILVARSGLGTINHTLLSAQALKSNGVKVLGVILNQGRRVQPDDIVRDNVETIERFSGVPVLGLIDPLDLSGGDLLAGIDALFAKSMPRIEVIVNAVRSK
jgi:dethiobiotin synthetase